MVGEPEYMDLQPVMDSGAADRVVETADIPGCTPTPSTGSKAGACFVAANGERIPNRGEVKLEMKSGKLPIHSTFQISKISKPLWSVGKLCDAGYVVEFKKGGATVKHEKSGQTVSSFERQQGLYIGNLQLRNPGATSSFPRQA